MRGATFEFGYSGRSAMMRVTRSQILTSVVMGDPRRQNLPDRDFLSTSPLGPPQGLPRLQVNRGTCRFGRYKNPRRPHPPPRASLLDVRDGMGTPLASFSDFAQPILYVSFIIRGTQQPYRCLQSTISCDGMYRPWLCLIFSLSMCADMFKVCGWL